MTERAAAADKYGERKHKGYLRKIARAVSRRHEMRNQILKPKFGNRKLATVPYWACTRTDVQTLAAYEYSAYSLQYRPAYLPSYL